MGLSVGEQLKCARTASRISLKDVAQATKIQPWVIESLEANELHTTMSPVYVKSFLATYARFLGLDANSLIAQLFPQPIPESSALASSVSPSLPRLAEFSRVLFRRAAIFAIGLAGLALVAHPIRWFSAKALHKVASLSVVKERSRLPDKPLELQGALPLELTLVVRRPTWVSVHADGKLLLQQQLLAGSQETWKAHRQFELIVGTPSEVEVLLNGQAISPLAIAHQGRLLITRKRIESLSESSRGP